MLGSSLLHPQALYSTGQRLARPYDSRIISGSSNDIRLGGGVGLDMHLPAYAPSMVVDRSVLEGNASLAQLQSHQRLARSVTPPCHHGPARSVTPPCGDSMPLRWAAKSVHSGRPERVLSIPPRPEISSKVTRQDIGSSSTSTNGTDLLDHAKVCDASAGNESGALIFSSSEVLRGQTHLDPVVSAVSEEDVSLAEKKVCFEDMQDLKKQLQHLRAVMDGDLFESFTRLERQLGSLVARVALLSEWRASSEHRQSEIFSTLDMRLATVEGEVCKAAEARTDGQRRVETLSAELVVLRSAGLGVASGFESRVKALEESAAELAPVLRALELQAFESSFTVARSQRQDSESGSEGCESADANGSCQTALAAELGASASGHRGRPQRRGLQKRFPQARAAMQLLLRSSQ